MLDANSLVLSERTGDNMTLFKPGDNIIVKNPVSSFYGQTGTVVYCGTQLCNIIIAGENDIRMPSDWLDYTTDEKIKRLPDKARALVLKIIPGKWVAYDDHRMHFDTTTNNVTPVFNTKHKIVSDLARIHTDNRKRKTIERKAPGCYWYSFHDITTKEPRCFVIQKITTGNLNTMREYCIDSLYPTDHK